MLLFTIESLSCFDEGFYPMFPSNRDGNFTHRYPTRQVRARVSFFTRGSDPHPPCESAGAGAGFIFHPWVTRGYPKFQILMVSTQSAHLNTCQSRSFGLAQQYPPLKSRSCNPVWCSSYSPTTFFSWFSNPPWPRDRIHLYFAQTRG
jgi:hypothetical protein